MAASALGLPLDDRYSFSDVSESAWYAQAVKAMAGMGFMSGNGDGTFSPEDTITYEQLLTALSSAAAWCSMEGYDLSQTPLTMEDWLEYSDYSDYAQCAARNMAQLELQLDGAAPGDAVTREMAAGLLCRMMERTGLIWD